VPFFFAMAHRPFAADEAIFDKRFDYELKLQKAFGPPFNLG